MTYNCDAITPYIRPLIIGIIHSDGINPFRSKVRLTANVCTYIRVHQLSCNTKVTEFDLSSLVDKYIGRLYICT